MITGLGEYHWSWKILTPSLMFSFLDISSLFQLIEHFLLGVVPS